MELTIKIDITERLEKSLHALTTAICSAGVCHASEKPENLPVETSKDSGPVITPTEPENAPEAKSEQPVEVKPGVVEVAAQNDNAEPVINKALKSWIKEVASEQPEKKPVKKRASKKAENSAVETPKEPDPVVTPSETENAAEAKSEQPVKVKPEAVEPAASDNDDPMCRMTVMDAMQTVMNEINEKGLEMADVNARVRARAAEAGIAYSSIICLIKALGYKEARRVALGEK